MGATCAGGDGAAGSGPGGEAGGAAGVADVVAVDGGDVAAATPVVVAAVYAGEDAQKESILARISAMVGDEDAGSDTPLNSAGGGAHVGAEANRRRTAPVNSGHVGTPMVLSISSNHRSVGPVILKETVRTFRNSGVSHASKHWLQRCNQRSGSVLPSKVGMRILGTAVVVSMACR